METVFAAGAASFAGFLIGQSIVKKKQATTKNQTISSFSKNKLHAQCLPLPVRAKSILRHQFTQPRVVTHQKITGVPRRAASYFPSSALHSQFGSRMRPRDFHDGSRMLPLASDPTFSGYAVDTNVLNSRNIPDVRHRHPHAKQSRFLNNPVSDAYVQRYDCSSKVESPRRTPRPQTNNTVPVIHPLNTKGLGNDAKQSALFHGDNLTSYMAGENARDVNHQEEQLTATATVTATENSKWEHTARQKEDAEQKQILDEEIMRLQQLFDDQLELHNLKLTESYYVAVNQLKLENLHVESHLQNQFKELLAREYSKLKEHHDNAWCYIAQQEKVVAEKIREMNDVLGHLHQQEQLAMSIHRTQSVVQSSSIQGDNKFNTTQEFNISGFKGDATEDNDKNYNDILAVDNMSPSTCVLRANDIAIDNAHCLSSELTGNKHNPCSDSPNELVYNEYTCF